MVLASITANASRLLSVAICKKYDGFAVRTPMLSSETTNVGPITLFNSASSSAAAALKAPSSNGGKGTIY
jgi:hypothetical protein